MGANPYLFTEDDPAPVASGSDTEIPPTERDEDLESVLDELCEDSRHDGWR